MTRIQRLIPDLTSLPHARVRDIQREEANAYDIANTIMHREGRAFETACLVGTDDEMKATAENLRDAIVRAVTGPDRRNGCGND